MFCNNCGSAITAEQSICGQCGKSTTGARVASAARMRVAEHVHLLAILWFVDGALLLIPAIIMAALAGIVTSPVAWQHRQPDNLAFVIVPGIFGILCAIFLIFAALRFIAGWGLLKLAPWGRIFALVMAFLDLLHIPLGTALGVYTLFVLLPDAAGDEYGQMSQTRG